MSERSTSSSDAPSVVSGRLPKYSMPTNLPAFMRLIASSTAWRSGCRSSHVELTKMRATVGSILRLLAWRARPESARLSSPKGERLGTTFQQKVMPPVWQRKIYARGGRWSTNFLDEFVRRDLAERTLPWQPYPSLAIAASELSEDKKRLRQ